MTTAIAPVDRLTERSATNPGGALFRNFTLTLTKKARDLGEPGEMPDAEGDAEDAAEEDGAPTEIAIAISSEEPVLRYDWRAGVPYYEVLDHATKSVDLSYVADGIPFCLDHSLSRQIGIGDTITVGSDKLLRTTVRRGNHPDAAWVFADMASGVRKKVSVGYDPGEEYVETKGKNDEYATRRYTRWMPYEVSSVTVPADYGVGVGRSASGAFPSTVAAKVARTSEDVMGDEEKETAGRGSAATVDKMVEQRAIAALAKKHGRESDLPSWIIDGLSLEQVRDKIMDSLTAANAARADVGNAAPRIEVGREREEDKPFNSVGEQLRDVIIAGRDPSRISPQLRGLRAASGQGEGMPADGGFALHPAFVTEIQRVMYANGEVLKRVRKLPVGANSNGAKILALKENSRANGSRLGGVMTYYADEGDTVTSSKIAVRTVELNLRKLIAAIPMTDELIADTTLLDALVRQVVPEEMTFRTEDAIINGTGSGQALGVINSPAVVTQAIEGSQTIANTNSYLWFNVAKMYSQLLPGSVKNAVWFINPIVFAKILTATAGTGNPSAPIFLPPGALKDVPYATIYGLPVIPLEQCAAEGTPGDIILADMSQYLFIDKGGINAAQSFHVRFLQDEMVLRWTYRFDGSPSLNSPVTPYKGSFSMSPFILLATRS